MEGRHHWRPGLTFRFHMSTMKTPCCRTIFLYTMNMYSSHQLIKSSLARIAGQEGRTRRMLGRRRAESEESPADTEKTGSVENEVTSPEPRGRGSIRNMG